MNDYSNFLVPLITTLGLMFTCFVLYIIFGNKLCPSYYGRKEIQRKAVNEVAASPLDETSYACKHTQKCKKQRSEFKNKMQTVT